MLEWHSVELWQLDSIRHHSEELLQAARLARHEKIFTQGHKAGGELAFSGAAFFGRQSLALASGNVQ